MMAIFIVWGLKYNSDQLLFFQLWLYSSVVIELYLKGCLESGGTFKEIYHLFPVLTDIAHWTAWKYEFSLIVIYSMSFTTEGFEKKELYLHVITIINMTLILRSARACSTVQCQYSIKILFIQWHLWHSF